MFHRENHWPGKTDALRPVFALVVVLGMAATMRAEPDFLRDAEHTLLARNILDRDPRLSRLNLGVKVHNRLATLWGPVPDESLGVLAAELLRGQLEFRAVYNELYFQPEDVSQVIPFRPKFLPDVKLRPLESPGLATMSLMPPVGVEQKAPPRPVGSPGSLTTRPTDRKPPVAYLPEKIAPAQTEPAAPLTAAEANPGSGGLGTPQSIPPTSRETDNPPVPSKPSLLQALRSLQQSQERFRTLQLDVQDGVVTLRGPGQRGDALYELARAVSQLPGVVRVVVKENN